MDKATAKAILEALILPIEGVHGQCCVCIESFVEYANERLAKIECPYRLYQLEWDDERQRDFETVRVVEAKGAQRCTSV